MNNRSPSNWLVPLILIPLLAVLASFAVRGALAIPPLLQGGTAVSDPSSTPSVETTQGASRQTALPLATVNRLPNWEFSLLEEVRGEKAWEMISEANMFNQPAPDGYEYLLLKIRLKNRQFSVDEDSVSFAVTGDQQRVYYSFSFSTVVPEPELDTYMLGQQESEGWIEFVVVEGERELVLIFEDYSDYEQPLTFYALEEGANPLFAFERNNYQTSSAGSQKDDALAIGRTAVTPNWQVTVLDTVRGGKANEFLESIDGYYLEPKDGFEYLLAQVEVRYIGSETSDPEGVYATENMFVFEEDGTVYETVYVNLERFAFPSTSFYPEGVVQGWVAYEVPPQAKGVLTFLGDFFEPSPEDLRYWRVE